MFWATTIPGRFPDTEPSGDTAYNHRIYATTTRDRVTFTPARLWFDPGFNCIDSTVVKADKGWIMVFKDERKTPLQNRLRLAFADSPSGPWKDVSDTFTEDWVEGPSVMKIGREWQRFEGVTDKVGFPADHRHGENFRKAGLAAQESLVTERKHRVDRQRAANGPPKWPAGR